jgi:2-phosphoglycerate kinase
MAKTLIIDADRKSRVPFLRGILTRSLCRAGMSFEDAYGLASDVRHELEGVEDITAHELRRMVVRKLTVKANDKITERYQAHDAVSRPVIYVEGLDGQRTPYSDEHFCRELEVIGLTPNETRIAGKKMHDHLVESGHTHIHVDRLGYLTYRYLYKDKLFGREVAERYLTWVNFTRSGCPLILLIGGTAGCGKSTISTALASRLEIVRTQSTDMLREVMRMMIPKRLLPVLHESSFNAWRKLPAEHCGSTDDPENMLVAGYRTQAELLYVPCEAVIQRALKEKVSLLLEGVHIAPPLLQKIPKDSGVVVVHIMLAVLKQKELKKRIKGRSVEAPQRRSQRYPASFEDIWRLQAFLLNEADQAETPIVVNMDKEEAMQEIMKIVITKLTESHSASPREVFGKMVRPTHQQSAEKTGRVKRV